MYSIQRFLGLAKALDKHPLYSKIRGKTLRLSVSKITAELVRKQSSKILKKRKKKIFLSFFNYNSLSQHLFYYLRNKIYYKVAKNIIFKSQKKIISYNQIFRFDLIDLIYILKIFFKFLSFLLINFLKKKNLNKYENFDILVNYQNGNRLTNKSDFPYHSNLKKIRKKKLKIKYLISSPLSYNGKKGLKSIKYNYITTKKFRGLKHKPFYCQNVSAKSKKGILFCIKNFFSDPLIYSTFLEFIMIYEYYFQLIKFYKIKVYINNNWDNKTPAIRQAINDLSGITIAFQTSYFNNKDAAFLSHPTDVVFSWGKNSKKFLNLKYNYINKLFKIDPNIFYCKRNKKKTVKKIITLFDTSFKNDGYISPILYNEFLKILLIKINSSKNLYLQLKFKYSDHEKYIDKENLLLIQKLKKNKKFKYFKKKEDNNIIIANSDHVVSIGTLTISAEALFKNIDSIVLCNDAIDKKFLKQANNIYPFAFNNLIQFQKNFDDKINFKNNNLKIKKLRNFFFENNQKKIKPHEIIESFIKT